MVKCESIITPIFLTFGDRLTVSSHTVIDGYNGHGQWQADNIVISVLLLFSFSLFSVSHISILRTHSSTFNFAAVNLSGSADLKVIYSYVLSA